MARRGSQAETRHTIAEEEEELMLKTEDFTIKNFNLPSPKLVYSS